MWISNRDAAFYDLSRMDTTKKLCVGTNRHWLMYSLRENYLLTSICGTLNMISGQNLSRVRNCTIGLELRVSLRLISSRM